MPAQAPGRSRTMGGCEQLFSASVASPLSKTASLFSRTITPLNCGKRRAARITPRTARSATGAKKNPISFCKLTSCNSNSYLLESALWGPGPGPGAQGAWLGRDDGRSLLAISRVYDFIYDYVKIARAGAPTRKIPYNGTCNPMNNTTATPHSPGVTCHTGAQPALQLTDLSNSATTLARELVGTSSAWA